MLHYDSSLRNFDFDSRTQGCKTAKTSVPGVLQSSQLNLMEFGILLQLAGLMNFILILFCLIDVQERESFTSLHLGIVHPLQDVALHQCPPLLSV